MPPFQGIGRHPASLIVGFTHGYDIPPLRGLGPGSFVAKAGKPLISLKLSSLKGKQN
jgi:hypothetical protein